MYGLPSRFLAEIPADLVEVTKLAAPAYAGAGGGGRYSRGSYGGGGPGRGSYGGGGQGAGRRGWDDSADWRDRDDDGIGGSGKRITGLEKQPGDEVVEQFFAAGDRVLHATLGEGTVASAEPGGIIVVRFENDGSERRLMATIAPLRKLRA